MRFLCLCFSDVVGFSLAGIRDANKDFVTGSEIRDQVPNHSQQFGWDRGGDRVVGYDLVNISLLMMINTQTAGLTPLVTASVDTQHAAGTAEVYRDNIMNHD